jgi:hypothetical protein
LQRIQEPHMDQGRLGIVEAGRAVSRETKVRVLIDGARNQTRDGSCSRLVLAKNVRERGCEGCGALDACKVNLANV